MKYSGSCHCGAIQFEVEAPERLHVEECNCSICSKSGFLHLLVPGASFRLLQGQDHLSCYCFNTGIANHTFCKKCDVKAFYTSRSNPDGIDINVHCIDTRPTGITSNAFDGVNWEENAHKLVHLSKPVDQD